MLICVISCIRSIETKRNAFGEKHPDVALTMNNLGLVFQELKQYEEAKELFESAYAIQSEYFNMPHPDVAASLNNMAQLNFVMNFLDEAKEYFERTVEMKKIVYGCDHPSLATTLNSYAGLLFSERDYHSAKVRTILCTVLSAYYTMLSG